jgi:hypothetical protein
MKASQKKTKKRMETSTYLLYLTDYMQGGTKG